MTMIENLTNELAGKFGVGSAAQPLMRELLQQMTGSPGGLSGFLDRFRSAGYGSEVSSFLGGKGAAALPAKGVDAALGSSTVTGIAQRVGLKPAVASTVLGFAIPKVVGMLTPGGKVPTTMPTEVQSFLRSTEQVDPMATATIRENDQVDPVAMTTVREKPRETMPPPRAETRAVPERRSTNLWIWPLLGLCVLGALIWWLVPKGGSQAPRVAAARTVPMVTRTHTIVSLDRTLNSHVLNFGSASATLPAESAPALQQAAADIKNMPAGTRIEIAGHTDNQGDANANMALSQQRAESVRDALVRDGVDPAEVSAKGYGDTKPIASNDTANGRTQNRRIEFNQVVAVPANEQQYHP